MDKQRKERNGKIEFFRFVFSVIIILFHCNRILGNGGSKDGYELGMFPRGYIGVEFFYFVSGYLMANSLFQSQEEKKSLPFDREYWKFLWGKLLPILPYHLLAFCVLFIQDWFFKEYSIFKAAMSFLYELPGLFFLQKAGFDGCRLNTVEWYISAMLLAMAVIYPLCKKAFDTYSGVVAPLSAIFVMGWIFFSCGAMSGASRKMPLELGYVCLFRAFAEINLGIFAFRAARVLKRERWSQRERMVLSAIEWSGYAVAVLFSLFAVPIRYELIPLFCLLVSVTLTFSQVSYNDRVWNHQVIYFLGKCSLVFYLNQLSAIYFVQRYASGWTLIGQGVGVLFITAAVSFISMKVGELWLARIRRSHFHHMIVGLGMQQNTEDSQGAQ